MAAPDPAAKQTAAVGVAPSIDVVAAGDRFNAGSTIATSAFSTTAPNELLLAFVSSDGPASGGMTVTGVTGGGLTWALVRRTNVQLGDAEIWRAFAPTTLANVLVTATLGQSTGASITVVTFQNVDVTGTDGAGAIGATGSAAPAEVRARAY
jgi:hypothetical protein